MSLKKLQIRFIKALEINSLQKKKASITYSDYNEAYAGIALMLSLTTDLFGYIFLRSGEAVSEGTKYIYPRTRLLVASSLILNQQPTSPAEIKWHM
jgi:hypothetical protein